MFRHAGSTGLYGSQRGEVAGGDSGQPMRPVLRPCHHLRGAGRQIPVLPELPVQLRAEVQPHGQARAARFREGRAQRVIFGAQIVGAGVFVIHHGRGERTVGGQKRGAGAMGRDRDAIDPGVTRQTAQGGADEIPLRARIEMRPWRAGDHPVGRGFHRHLGCAGRIDQRELHVGLADVDDRDGPHQGM